MMYELNCLLWREMRSSNSGFWTPNSFYVDMSWGKTHVQCIRAVQMRGCPNTTEHGNNTKHECDIDTTRHRYLRTRNTHTHTHKHALGHEARTETPSSSSLCIIIVCVSFCVSISVCPSVCVCLSVRWCIRLPLRLCLYLSLSLHRHWQTLTRSSGSQNVWAPMRYGQKL